MVGTHFLTTHECPKLKWSKEVCPSSLKTMCDKLFTGLLLEFFKLLGTNWQLTNQLQQEVVGLIACKVAMHTNYLVALQNSHEWNSNTCLNFIHKQFNGMCVGFKR